MHEAGAVAHEPSDNERRHCKAWDRRVSRWRYTVGCYGRPSRVTLEREDMLVTSLSPSERDPSLT
ncbi:hypothetical protein IG631_08437 [Alternaria alternata]|nr:hypothetical protein IG631_08437 [Alternaria alternata]